MGPSSKSHHPQKHDNNTLEPGLKLPAQPKPRSKSPAPAAKAAAAGKLKRPECVIQTQATAENTPPESTGSLNGLWDRSLVGLSKLLPKETAAAKQPLTPTNSVATSASGSTDISSDPHAFRSLPGFKWKRNIHGLIDCFADCDKKSFGYGGFKKRRNSIVHLREIHGQDIGGFDRTGGRNKKRQGKRELKEIGEMAEGSSSGLDSFGRGGEETDYGMESDCLLEPPLQFWVRRGSVAGMGGETEIKECSPRNAEKEAVLEPEPAHIYKDREMGYGEWPEGEITFEPYRPTQFDLMGVWLERKLGTRLDWWPLSPPVRPDRSGLTRMSWKCKCGSTLSSAVSNEAVGRYQRSRSSPGGGTGTGGTITTGPSQTPIQLSTFPSPPVGARSGGIRPPQVPMKLSRSLTIPLGVGSGGTGMVGGSPLSSQSPRWPPSALLARSDSMSPSRKATASSVSTLVEKPGFNVGSYILCCIRKGWQRTVLVQMGGGSFRNDQELFRNLRAEYRRVRGWRRWMGLSAVVQIKFVRFTQYYLNFVDCHESEVLPPHTNPEYDYAPKPPTDPPTFPAAELMHCFDSPGCAGTATHCLDLTPKRVAGKLERGKRAEGWGLQPTEGLSFLKLPLLLAAVRAGTLVFAMWWMVMHPRDFQNAFVPATYAASVVAIGVVLPELGVVYLK